MRKKRTQQRASETGCIFPTGDRLSFFFLLIYQWLVCVYFSLISVCLPISLPPPIICLQNPTDVRTISARGLHASIAARWQPKKGNRGRTCQSKRRGRQIKWKKRWLSLCIPPLLRAGAVSLLLPLLFMCLVNGGADITGFQVTLHEELLLNHILSKTKLHGKHSSWFYTILKVISCNNHQSFMGRASRN